MYSIKRTHSRSCITAQYTFDPFGGRTSVGSSFNNLHYTSYSWDPATSLLQSTTDALGRQTAYTYDSLGNQTSVTYLAGTPQAATTASVYDPAFSEITSITDPLQHTTTFAYDSLGNLTTITNALQQSIAFAHNPAGQITSITPPSPAGTMQLGYAGPDLTSMTDALGNVVHVTADGAGRVVSKALPMGQTTFYQYDALDDLLRVQDALGNATALAYDPNGNLQSVADALLHSTAYMYDVRNQRIKRTDPLQNAETSTYDLNGNLSSFADRKGQATIYTYDALDRIQQVQYADHSTVTYTYDAGNRITQIVDSLSGTITRQYDGLDRLTLEQTPQGTVAYTYDAAGRRTTMTVSGQANPVAYSYDNANRLTQVTQGLNTVSVGYDAAGRRASLTLPNGIVAAYTYDLASELTGITYTNGANIIGDLTYAYDQNGNRTQVGGTLASTGLPTALSGATYNANNQLQQWGSAVFSYDLNGNMTGDGTNAYAWDARNQLASITGTVLVAPQYDAVGRRTLNPAGESLLYDGSNIVQEQSNGSANINLLTGLGVDERFVWSDSAGDHSYLTDGLNSTVAMSDASAGVTAQYTYEPFGGKSSVGSSSNNLQYTGRENDGTGLYYYRARYYSPQLQRFVSEDPIGFDGGDPNLYAYVANAPMRYVDPSGNNAAVLGGWGAFVAASQFVPGWDVLVDGALLGGVVGLAGVAAYTSFAKPPANAWDPNGPKAPGSPTSAEGFDHPKAGPNWVPNQTPGKAASHGWEDSKGRVWCPTGHAPGRAHGGPHWDVQLPSGGYKNVRPGQNIDAAGAQ